MSERNIFKSVLPDVELQICLFHVIILYAAIFYSVTKLRFRFSNIRVPDRLHTKYEINTVLLRMHSAILFLLGKNGNRYTGEQTYMMFFCEHSKSKDNYVVKCH